MIILIIAIILTVTAMVDDNDRHTDGNYDDNNKPNNINYHTTTGTVFGAGGMTK